MTDPIISDQPAEASARAIASEDLDLGERIALASAEVARRDAGEEPALAQRGDDRGREGAQALGLGGVEAGGDGDAIDLGEEGVAGSGSAGLGHRGAPLAVRWAQPR